MGEKTSFSTKEHRFFGSLLSALGGVGLIGLSVHFGAKNDFLATLFIKGGDFVDYLLGIGVISSFILGVVLVARHVAKEGVAEHFYEHTPY
ncbi:hypothetical protein A8O14_02525 [Polynucleobacter wuianus]|uniref:Uncharacterized protein n=1 Tax=Polynucleobacter wuianus TaxID=1743168 RepID=A0A191UDD9_9BURK|nr:MULTISPECIES: hypothetical protein [Polynucleobacter]ANI99068.1 hypothetical protein A8O14_02525 [Polynucleobacter wuianus]MBU3552365.1 hypothetical protein [Polynucleobacter sp. MWH-Post4-6-1]